MFKKILRFIALTSMLCVPLALHAQNVFTSATIVDSLGNAYAYGSYVLAIVPGPNMNVNSNASTTTQSGGLTSAGAFSNVMLGDTSVLGGGTRWRATICASTGVCYSILINVTAATPDLSSVLCAAAPLVSGTGSGYTFGAATGAGTNMFTMTDTAANTGTGAVLAVRTAASSSAYPFLTTAGGAVNGWLVDSSGNLDPVTVNTVNIGTTALPVKGIYLGLAATNNVKLAAAAQGQATVVTIPDPGTVALTANGLGATVEYCGATTGGTQACAKTKEYVPFIVYGDVLLNTAASQSITTLPFTAATYSCSGSDLTTAAGVVSFSSYANASVTIAETNGTTGDHLRFQCVGY